MRTFVCVSMHAHENACIFVCLCICMHDSPPVVDTLMLTQANVITTPWTNAPLEGLEEELLLTQTKVLAHKHVAGQKWRSLFVGCKVHRDKSPKGKPLENSDYVQALQSLYRFNIQLYHPHHHLEGPLCPGKSHRPSREGWL